MHRLVRVHLRDDQRPTNQPPTSRRSVVLSFC